MSTTTDAYFIRPAYARRRRARVTKRSRQFFEGSVFRGSASEQEQGLDADHHREAVRRDVAMADEIDLPAWSGLTSAVPGLTTSLFVGLAVAWSAAALQVGRSTPASANVITWSVFQTMSSPTRRTARAGRARRGSRSCARGLEVVLDVRDAGMRQRLDAGASSDRRRGRAGPVPRRRRRTRTPPTSRCSRGPRSGRRRCAPRSRLIRLWSASSSIA